MRLVKLTLIICTCFAGVLAFITTIIAIGYALKIIAAFGAVIGVLGLIGLFFYALIYEFVLKKGKPPK